MTGPGPTIEETPHVVSTSGMSTDHDGTKDQDV